jgi:hypothetical protein
MDKDNKNDNLIDTGTVLPGIDLAGLAAFTNHYNRVKDIPDREPDWVIIVDGVTHRATTPDMATKLLAAKCGLPDLDEFDSKYEIKPNGEFMVNKDIWDKWNEKNEMELLA